MGKEGLNPRKLLRRLRNRAADNWRVLLAIADAAGEEWARAARAAAIELSRGQDEDAAVQLLQDIREIFDHLALDRIGSGRLVGELVDLPDGRWSEWRGKLTQGALAQLLAPFGIRPMTVWPPVAAFSKKVLRVTDASNLKRRGPRIATKATHRHIAAIS